MEAGRDLCFKFVKDSHSLAKGQNEDQYMSKQVEKYSQDVYSPLGVLQFLNNFPTFPACMALSH